MPRYKKSEIPIPYSLEIKEKGYKENLKTLFPKIHILIPVPPGVLIEGGDAVGENNYTLFSYLDIDNNFTPKLDVKISSKFFKPSTIYLQFKIRESIGIEWQHHLFMSNAPGLSTIKASLEVGKYNDFKKLYTMPGLSFGFTYPKWDARLFTGYFVEKRDTNGIIIDSYIRRYVQNSQIKLLFGYDYYGNAINSIKAIEIKPRSSLKNPISGYHNLLSLEYSFPFLKIRKGLWNPNIYLEDLSTVFFVESYFNDKNNNAPSFIGGGVELRQEVSLSLQQIKFPIYLGLGIDKDGNKRIYGGISFGSNNGDHILPNIRKRYSSKQW